MAEGSIDPALISMAESCGKIKSEMLGRMKYDMLRIVLAMTLLPKMPKTSTFGRDRRDFRANYLDLNTRMECACRQRNGFTVDEGYSEVVRIVRL